MNSWAFTNLAASMIFSRAMASFTERDIASHRATEQKRVLQDNADVFAEVVLVVVAHVFAVDLDRAALHIVKSGSPS